MIISWFCLPFSLNLHATWNFQVNYNRLRTLLQENKKGNKMGEKEQEKCSKKNENEIKKRLQKRSWYFYFASDNRKGK